MGKPATNTTRIKHFGTILLHPMMYRKYKQHKDAFAQSEELALHQHYAGEVDAAAGHPYPGAHGNIQQRGVIYPGQVPGANTRVQGRLAAHVPFDHQASLGVQNLPAAHTTAVVLRQEGQGVAMHAAVKRGPHNDDNRPDVGRTQHTTMTGGVNVASAGLFHEGKMTMSSGHYQPGADAAVKMAIGGKTTGTVLRRETTFQNPAGQNINDQLTLKNRMATVAAWARRQGL